MTAVSTPGTRTGKAVAPLVAILAGSIILAAAVITAPDVAWYPWVLTAATAAAALIPAIIDGRTHKLPNRYTGPLALAAAIQVIAFSIRAGDPWSLLWAGIAAAVTFVLFAAMALRDYVGFGDVKYAAALALAVAITTGLMAIWIMPVAVLLGAGGRGVRYLAGHREHRQALGPYIFAVVIALLIYGAIAVA
jgi:prepilin signal peptidase PulO-like enzyme (type II secretory pathway)